MKKYTSALAGILVLIAAPTVNGEAIYLSAVNKVEICHFQEENDSWKLISVGRPAVRGHLENHDDAFPGGTTTKTGTVLDANCVETVAQVQCPCFVDTEAIDSTFGCTPDSEGLVCANPTEIDFTLVQCSGNFSAEDDIALARDSSQFTLCRLHWTSDPVTITPEEAEACKNVILSSQTWQNLCVD